MPDMLETPVGDVLGDGGNEVTASEHRSCEGGSACGGEIVMDLWGHDASESRAVFKRDATRFDARVWPGTTSGVA
jgi:hypothetical protein